MATTFTEVCESQKTGPVAIRWTPGAVPGCGTLIIDQKRASVTYLVYEIDAGWGCGRAFTFTKPLGEPGTDAEGDRYCVRVGDGDRVSCECRGFLRHGTKCKHILAAEALTANGWL